jgi:sulfite oxidase
MTTPHVSRISRRRLLQATTAATAVLATGKFPTSGFAQETNWTVHTVVPPNREASLADLIADWKTPVNKFYVRSHAASPIINASTFRLKINGLVNQPANLSLQEMSDRFQRVDVTATMTCAGNRRTEHSRTRPIDGVPWEAGAIGNATWSGYRLSDVLKAVGLQEEARHVWFDGSDQIERSSGTIGFGASIPISKAMDDSNSMPGAIVCTHMNGEPLTADHGFPVRTVVPGYIGARSVKWLSNITVSNRESPNHYQQTAYKVVTENTPAAWSETAPLYRFPLNSVICNIEGVPDGYRVSGYALPSGHASVQIKRVLVSDDGGNRWQEANLIGESNPYCWQLWTIDMQTTNTNFVVRAIDSDGNTQLPRMPWNLKGYMYNAWHSSSLTP